MRTPQQYLRCVSAALAVLCLSGVVPAAFGEALTGGTAITDPAALRQLDLPQAVTDPHAVRGFSLRRILGADGAADAALLNDEFFARPAMLPVRQAIDRDIDTYVARHSMDIADDPRAADDQTLQIFDHALLYSAQTRFALAGIVNRMDRAFVSPATCGEIRLIYRLVRNGSREGEPARLPMTLNVVLAAKGKDDDVTCAAVARRWLEMRDDAQTGAALVRHLTMREGPLASIQPEQLIRIEMNLQIGHQPKSGSRAFRTDYLMKVFRYDWAMQRFNEAPLENQIDRDRILSDPGLGSEFAKWLLQPEHLNAFDRGTVLVPEKFLARSVIASTPVGFVRSKLQPEFGLVQSSRTGKQATFSSRDIVAALKRVVDNGVAFENIRSVAGFERRLNDLTCAGCHQTRGVGGFHFPGADWMSPASTPVANVPASPHFIGDQPRRRDILKAFRDGRTPDFSRGFSSRPQLRGDATLLGTGYYDGWGAHCYDARVRGAADRSFRSWTCAKGLSCQVVGDADRSERMGMCFVGSSAGEQNDERRRAGLKTTRPSDRGE